MKVFPTLQIENGLTVPFYGEPPALTSPKEVVERLLDHECTHVTFIDRDAATGKGNNRDLILQLAQRFIKNSGKVCIQVGGGIRSSDLAQLYLDHGVTWLLVNAIIQRSPLMTEQLVARFQTRLTAAVAARRGQFQESARGVKMDTTLEQATQYIKDLGIRRALFIDIPGPGDLEPDFESARRIAEISKIPLLMSGTITTEEQIRQASTIPGLHGLLLDACNVVDNPRLVPHSTQPCA